MISFRGAPHPPTFDPYPMPDELALFDLDRSPEDAFAGVAAQIFGRAKPVAERAAP